MSIGHRLQAYSAKHPISMNKKIDVYLSENLADMMAEYKIADRSDLSELDDDFIKLESRMEELENWKGGFSKKLTEGRSRMDRLLVKEGMEK